METSKHIECKLQRLSVSINLPAPTEPLGEVIRHFTNNPCSAPQKTNQPDNLLATGYLCIQ